MGIFKKEKKEMFLIVGLGNPGKEYERTKHNTGYMAVDNIANKLGVEIYKNKFNGLHCKTKINGKDVILLKPTTYMNLSGNSIIQYVKYYNIPASNVVIIYDDVDIPFGSMRIKSNGSAGTHNGMKSIVSALKTEEFPRIRIGIKPEPEVNLIDYVLSNYTNEQIEKINELSENVYEAVEYIVDGNIERAMNKFN